MNTMDTTKYPLGTLRLATIVAWSAVAIGCLIWEGHERRRSLTSNARAMAQASFEKDLVFRRWAANHGGVYVPVTPSTSPNPYLNVPERDIVTPSGRALTLINPAYMNRQIYELSRSSRNAPQGHITSLTPLRPENGPDPWETKALQAFAKGVAEVGEFGTISGREFYYYMRPLIAEKACLSCHAAQGYREGEVRGGIRVSVPVGDLIAAAAHERVAHAVLIASVWLLGLGGIWFGFRGLRRGTEALLVERNNLSSIFDAAPVSMLLIDDRMEVARVNAAMQRNFACDFDRMPDRRRGVVLGCLYALKDSSTCGFHAECAFCQLNDAMQQAMQGRSSAGESTLVTAGPQGAARLWVSYGVEPVQLGGRRFVLLSLVDITFRREYEDALRESELRYRMMVESLPALVFKIGADGRVRFHDNKIEQLCGYAKDDFDSGKVDWHDLIDELDRAKVSQAFQDIALSGGESSFEFRIQTATGTRAWLFARIHLAPGTEAESGGVIGVMVDVTEQKQLEERYLQSQKMEAVGRLAGGIAHDFNNLLTVIMGYSDILSHAGGDDAVVRVAAGRILTASENAASLTRQLLTFSRKQIFNPVLLNLSQVVAAIEPMMQRLIKEDIELTTATGPVPCLVMADKGQMEQVLMNLAVNARDAMPSGGTLKITTSTIDLDPSYCRQIRKDLAPGPYVLLSVSDTGVGMDEETIGHVFDPFFTTKELGKGTGLGLATVHGIVKQSGGDIWVYSEPGRGTTFRIYFPLYRGCEEVAVPPVQQHEQRKGSGCIMVVEDNEAIRVAVTEFLSVCGYSVVTASSGEDALLAWARQGNKVDLLITDVVMPGMDGYSLVQQMQEKEGDLKVLYMSGYTEHSQLREDVENHEVCFLQKPFTMNMLVDKVFELLPHSD